jgi:hypothetical protein
MKYPQTQNKSILIREVYEDTYENIYDYIVDTMIWQNRVDELHIIWRKTRTPNQLAQDPQTPNHSFATIAE